MDVDDAPAASKVGDQLWQLGEDLLEEDRDVLDRQAFDRLAVAVRSLGDGLAGPEELQHPAPIQRGHD